jgi:hypothetical protein
MMESDDYYIGLAYGAFAIAVLVIVIFGRYL